MDYLNGQFDASHPHAAAEASWLVFFARDPFADVRRTVAKRDTVALARPEEANDVSIHEDDVPEIQHKGSASRFPSEQRGQFGDVVGVKATAHGEHDVAVRAALDFQH
jgi:hypothetical protein